MSHTPEEAAGALVLQQFAFPLDLVTLFKLLISFKEEDRGKQSLIPTAEEEREHVIARVSSPAGL